MTDLTQAEFYDRCERAFDPHVRCSLVEPADLNAGGHGQAANAAILARMDALLRGDALPDAPALLSYTEAELEAAHAENAATPIIPAYTSRYDRQIKKRTALEKELADLTPDTPRYHEAMADLAETKKRIKIELDRSTDDKFRELERVDEYKLTIGKDERNTSRRKRPVANAMTPKEVLAAETPEEKKARLLKRDAERKRLSRAKAKKGPRT